jgi:hypothetical protein
MHQSAVRWPLLAAVLAFAWALTAGGAPAAPATDTTKSNKNDSSADHIRKLLDQNLDNLEIVNQTLDNAIAQLHEQTKINFVLDRITIQQMGIDPANSNGQNQQNVDIKLQNVKWKTALRNILSPYNLSYAIVGETVVITSEEMAIYRQLRQRVTIDLDRVQVGVALKQLAHETAANILLDSGCLKEAQAPVTLPLDDVPLETAVRLIAEMGGLKAVRVGNVLFVTSKTRANEMKSDPDLVPRPQPGAQAMEDVAVPGVLMQGLRGVAVQPAIAPPNPPPAVENKTDTPPADKDAKPADKDKPPEDKPAPKPDKP